MVADAPTAPSDQVPHRYVWDELSAYGDVILEADETNTTLAEYTLANGQLVSQNKGGALSYYSYDAQGSVRSLTNSSGTPTDEYDYTRIWRIYPITSAVQIILTSTPDSNSTTKLICIASVQGITILPMVAS